MNGQEFWILFLHSTHRLSGKGNALESQLFKRVTNNKCPYTAAKWVNRTHALPQSHMEPCIDLFGWEGNLCSAHSRGPCYLGVCVCVDLMEPWPPNGTPFLNFAGWREPTSKVTVFRPSPHDGGKSPPLRMWHTSRLHTRAIPSPGKPTPKSPSG